MASRGITTLELVIGLAIGSAILIALLRFLVIGFPVSRTAYFQARANETARVHLERISREIREARWAATGAYPLVEMSPQRIIFFTDFNDDGVVERVRYELIGTNLERGVIDPQGEPLAYAEEEEVKTVVASAIRNGLAPIFVYYTGNYPEETEPLTPAYLTEVKYIQFSLVVDVDEAADPPPLVIRSQVQLRNLKTNWGEEGS
jgi:hypothetical protein